MVKKASIEEVGKNPIMESMDTLREICVFFHKVNKRAKGANLRHGQDMIQWAKKKRIRRPKQLQGAKVTLNRHPKLNPGGAMVLSFDDLLSPHRPLVRRTGEKRPPPHIVEGYWVLCSTIDMDPDNPEPHPWAVFQVCTACPMWEIETSLGPITGPADPRCKFIVTGYHEPEPSE